MAVIKVFNPTTETWEVVGVGARGPEGPKGDGSVEVEQARVDASGYTNETLKERLDKEYNEVTMQLAQKVGGAVKAEPENLSATTLGMITGNGGPVNLLSIPQDGSVDAKKLSPKLTKPSYNILDESMVETTGYYRNTDGKHIADSANGSTPLIPVKPNEEFTFVNLGGQMTYWEADGTTFIHGIETRGMGTKYHFTVPNLEGIAYVRISLLNSRLGANLMMILKGHYDLDDTPYYKYGAPMLSIPKSPISDLPVLVKNMEDKLTKPSYNILDESMVERTGYYRNTDGKHIADSANGSTPLIPVKPNEEFTFVNLGGQMTYWEADGTTFIHGIETRGMGTKYHFTVPNLEGIAYVRISLLNSRLSANSMMILKGHYDLEYLPYYRYGEMMPNSISEFNKITDDFRADLVKDIADTYTYENDLNFIKPFKRVKNPIITKSIVTDRINPTGVADPFIVMEKGRYHMFFEVIGGEHPTTGAKVDEIGHAYSDNLIDWTYTEIVLSVQEHGHRSAYPNVFKVDGEWYMLPDVTGNVKLYKATNFPLEWTFEADLLTGGFVDTNIFKIGSIWYMTTTIRNGNGVSLYYNDSGDWKNSNWTLHPGGTIIPNTPEFGQHRGGGNHMIVDDCVYLPIQEVPEGKSYGYSTRLYKLVNLSPTTVEAVDMGLLAIAQHNGDWNDSSMHHVSYAKYLDRKIFAVDGTGPTDPLGYSIGLYVENYV